MTMTWTLLSIVAVAGIGHWLTRPGERRPLALAMARLLRRAGRWLWAAGEGLEHGWVHARRTRQRIRLEIEETQQ